jgi:hypothetical protein
MNTSPQNGHVTRTLNGLLCSECGEPQYDSPSGAYCDNNHGGVHGIEPDPNSPAVKEMFRDAQKSIDAEKCPPLPHAPKDLKENQKENLKEEPKAKPAIEQVLVATEAQLRRKARIALKSGYLPSTVYTEDQVLTIVRAGEELGLPFMSSLRSIHLIEGKIGLDATVMRALVFRKIPGARIDFLECSAERCLVEMQRPGGKTNVFAFTIEDARRAGLLKKNNWIKYPISMLIARASALGIRAIFPDAILGADGLMYELDEISDEISLHPKMSERDIEIEKIRSQILALIVSMPEEKRTACIDQTNRAAEKYNIELLNKILARTKEIVETASNNNSTKEKENAPKETEGNESESKSQSHVDSVDQQ